MRAFSVAKIYHVYGHDVVGLEVDVSFLVKEVYDAPTPSQDGDQDDEDHQERDPGALVLVAVLRPVSLSVTFPVSYCRLDNLPREGFVSGSAVFGAFPLVPLTPGAVVKSRHPNAGVIDHTPSIVKRNMHSPSL